MTNVARHRPDDLYLSAVTGKGVGTPATLGEARWLAAKQQAIVVRVVKYQITAATATA